MRSHSYDASAKHDDFGHHDDVDDFSRSHRSRSSPSDVGARSAITYVGTTQEEQDRNALLSDPDNKIWMPALDTLREWYRYPTKDCRIPLLNS